MDEERFENTVMGNLALRTKYPKLGLAVRFIREKMGFSGVVYVRDFTGRKKKMLGYAYISGHRIDFDRSVEQREEHRIIENVVHEGIHAVGLRHMAPNFLSGKGRRCLDGESMLAHWVTKILLGQDTYEQMVFRYKNMGAHGALLLRQIAKVEAHVHTKNKLPNVLGDCIAVSLRDCPQILHDGRAMRWKQMTDAERQKQKDKMYIGRMKRNGWDMKYYSDGRKVNLE